jgi:hypothetical protein
VRCANSTCNVTISIKTRLSFVLKPLRLYFIAVGILMHVILMMKGPYVVIDPTDLGATTVVAP